MNKDFEKGNILQFNKKLGTIIVLGNYKNENSQYILACPLRKMNGKIVEADLTKTILLKEENNEIYVETDYKTIEDAVPKILKADESNKKIFAILERIEKTEKANKKKLEQFYLENTYKSVLEDLNILLFPVVSEKNLEKVCDICDGLVLTGSSADIPPHYYNEEPIPENSYDIDEFALDKKAIELFSKANKPILGICRGLQSINVCFGGSLNQRIENHFLEDGLHKVNLKKGTFLGNTYNKESIEVNSYHYQSIKEVAKNFVVSAKAEDGTIEAIENGNIIAVQWHPEKMKDMVFFNSFLNTFFK